MSGLEKPISNFPLRSYEDHLQKFRPKKPLKVNMVEAGGIEPPSERLSAETSTRVAFRLDLADPGSDRQDQRPASL